MRTPGNFFESSPALFYCNKRFTGIMRGIGGKNDPEVMVFCEKQQNGR